MSTWELKHQAALEEWKSRVLACRSSGLSVSNWCLENQISSKTYYHWEREVLGLLVKKAIPEGNNSAQLPAPTFAPVPVPAKQESTRGSIMASVRIGYAELDVYPGADAEVIAAICKAMQSC